MNIDPRLYTFGLALAAYGHIYACRPRLSAFVLTRARYAEQIERPGTRRLVRSLS
jgi:hypothetical protein